ncbi:MAG: SRPBCC domain-containing protein [Mariniblastus sp.]
MAETPEKPLSSRIESAKLMLSRPFSVSVDMLYKHFTEPEHIAQWFVADSRFRFNHTWGFVLSNGTPDAELVFGKFTAKLPAPAIISTPEEKEQLANYQDHDQSPSPNKPVITVWCQDVEDASHFWFRHIFESESECQQVADSDYVQFWEEQLQNLSRYVKQQ